MSAHTPGPWRVEGLCIESPDGNVALVNLARASKDDARLIAASPDMLAALRWARDCFSPYLAAETTAERDYYFKDVEHAFKTIGEAIARAEGKP